MENIVFSKTKENSTNEVECESQDHHIFGSQGIVYCEWVSTGQTVNESNYTIKVDHIFFWFDYEL